ncbi:Cof-type HAD-IIB family hydrolase [Nonlabens marinus]|uniref:Hydrolase n=1 Tax=Nonlabens marinus S1-08 TaxID=1454201 RepID=W8VVA5_9FLAO|nr:Cof-type HAD-IIB family hydrolase [Nonlabens marinus]BAO55278.1 hydrolase [Nonlabens marinus S1-08]
MIQLIATDIDGTLLDDQRYISANTARIFKELNLPKILISARMPQAMYYLQEALEILDAPIICYNGALVLDQEEVLYSETIPYTAMLEIAEIGTQNGLHVSIYRNQEWFVEQMDEWTAREIHNTRTQPITQSLAKTLAYFESTKNEGGAHKIMFMGDCDKMNSAFAKAKQSLDAQVHLYRSKDTYTEISPKGISKKSALELLLEQRFADVPMSMVAAFGDNYNDTEMLAGVGHGVAVENAREEVKAAARYLAKHHKQDGVASWLQEQLLNKKSDS